MAKNSGEGEGGRLSRGRGREGGGSKYKRVARSLTHSLLYSYTVDFYLFLFNNEIDLTFLSTSHY